MGFFRKINNSVSEKNSEITVIARDAAFEGHFHFTSALHLHGNISGKIFSANSIILGRHGQIKGEIEAERFIVNGKFEGVANCNIINILESGEFFGVAICDELIIEPKAYFEGESRKKQLIENIKITKEEVKSIASSTL